jgi:nucleotide-binding universal stress UspA family protein
MASGNHGTTIVVGVDGSDASAEALREARRLAGPLQAQVTATACWEYPQMYNGYVLAGIEGFDERTGMILDEAITKAFGPETPANIERRLVHGDARSALIEASKDADLLAVGRRGRGGFDGLLVGSVSSACVAGAHCPVLVVHTPVKKHKH